MIKILFVCMGNICRSPTAEGVFQKLLDESELKQRIKLDSAGTHGYHIGAAPDSRSQQAALKRGIDLSHLRARQVTGEDFEKFDYILAMDANNLAHLDKNCPKQYKHKLHLFLSFAPHIKQREVPDPYYGGATGFEHVLDLTAAASQGLLAKLRQQLQGGAKT